MIVVFLSVILIWLIWLRFSKSNKHLPPIMNYGVPLLGHTPFWLSGDNAHLLFLSEILMNECLKTEKHFLRADLGPQKFYFLCDPEDLTTLSNACLTKPSLPYSYMKAWFGNSVFTETDPDIWRPRRKVLNHSFTQHMLDQYLKVFNTGSRSFAQTLEKQAGKGPFDQMEYMKALTSETIMKNALNLSVQDEEKNVQYIKLTTRLLQIWALRASNILLYLNFIYKWTAMYKEQTEILKILNKNLNEIIDEKKREFRNTKLTKTETDVRFKPIIDCLIEMEEKGEFTRKDVIDQLHIMLKAGYFTMAVSMSLVLCFLGSNPRVQEKLNTELREVFGESDRDVEKQDLSQLVYVEAVAKEILRLFPIAPIVFRYGETEVKFKNYTIPKGCYYVMMLQAANRMPAWGPDREVFRPERWLEPNGVPEVANAFTSFSIGKRSCIARTYTMNFLKVAVVHILRKYSIKGNAAKIQLRMDLLYTLFKGHEISIERREPAET